jgi:hypothetical protein
MPRDPSMPVPAGATLSVEQSPIMQIIHASSARAGPAAAGLGERAGSRRLALVTRCGDPVLAGGAPTGAGRGASA